MSRCCGLKGTVPSGFVFCLHGPQGSRFVDGRSYVFRLDSGSLWSRPSLCWVVLGKQICRHAHMNYLRRFMDPNGFAKVYNVVLRSLLLFIKNGPFSRLACLLPQVLLSCSLVSTKIFCVFWSSVFPSTHHSTLVSLVSLLAKLYFPWLRQEQTFLPFFLPVSSRTLWPPAQSRARGAIHCP